MERSIYRALDVPRVYRLAQWILAPGQFQLLTRAMASVRGATPPRGRLVLDVACGPVSWLWRLGVDPIGLDFKHTYTTQFAAAGGTAVTGSALELPFRSDVFDEVWSVGLFHHLDDHAARLAVGEMCRVAAADGRVVIVDAVLPRRAWRRPLAWIVRKLDRGRHVRTEDAHRAMLGGGWRVTRHLMAFNGMEVTIAERDRGVRR